MRKSVVWLSVGLLVLAASVFAQEVALKDPTGDDNGPGTYTYPTDTVYKPGSFDLTSFKLKVKGDKADIDVGLNSALEDPWRMGTGFSVQMVFVFVKSGKGAFTAGLPGLNIKFAEGEGWDKVVIMSPQGASRVKSEVESKVPKDMQGAVVIPGRVRGAGRTLSCSVPLADLGEGDPTTWGFQVVVQSNEGFPASTDLLTRKVNEFEGQHRFGGGNDGDCDPHVMDLLAGEGKGDKSEIAAQHEMLKYECGEGGETKALASLKMVYPAK
ncbi:MAG TPA: glucodextranase DOMON-like domain-containing protein [Thermoanaerobaculaceae bacterium]|nr:glucodextranase DOMON-like domain-containing protein [Thermoanaerobaculaceae bacterium]